MKRHDAIAVLYGIPSIRATRKAVALGRRNKARRRAAHQTLPKEVSDALAEA